MFLDTRLTRLDANHVRVDNQHGIDAILFANEQVPVESAAVTELLELLDLQETVERVAEASPDAFDRPPRINKVAITPDFHKARGIPVGHLRQALVPARSAAAAWFYFASMRSR